MRHRPPAPRYYRPDEEPENDTWDWEREERFGAGLCNRCGHADHEGSKCPIVTAMELKPDSRLSGG